MMDEGKRQQLKDSWKKFVNYGVIDEGVVREIVKDSWKRSRDYNVNPFKAKPYAVYKGDELQTHLRKYKKLIEISYPIMKKIIDFVRDGRFVIALADPKGCLLEIVGDEGIKKMAEGGDFILGASWAEEVVGTNAIGTSLYIGKPVQILGREHFRLESHNWSGSGAPIYDPGGLLIGSLVITGPYDAVHPHTLGMVVTAVNAIENQLKLDEAFSSLELSNNYKNAVIESISEGLLAVNEKGKITQINNIAAYYLGINSREVYDTSYELILKDKNKELIDIIKYERYVTDHEVDIFGGSNKTTCLVTSRPIKCNAINKGTVLLFSEISRAQKLVRRMSVAKGSFNFSDIIGSNPAFLETVELAQKAADSTSNVLLLGESGTGKEVFAQAIHNTGSRKRGPFVALNCGAIPRELIASELFGYVEGAFTGAKRGGKMGKFELASGGTIFLDEIGEMPLELQTSLLRVLETKTITRVSGNEVIPVDVRIIAATNKDLEHEVSRGKFRQDLFYRLNVFTIKMIPLRERKEDIPLLVNHFLDKLCTKFKKPSIKLDRKALEILEKYSWPGNIRELQNVVERAVNVCNDTVLSVEHLPEEIRNSKNRGNLMPIRNYERELIKTLLEKHNRNITRVANELGVARTTVYQKLARYNL